jgi:hypothetical protein
MTQARWAGIVLLVVVLAFVVYAVSRVTAAFG